MTNETSYVIAIIDRKWKKLSTTDNLQFYRYFRRLWEFIRSNTLSNEILERLLYNRDTPVLVQLEGKLASKLDAENIMNGKWAYYDDNVGGEERDIAAFVRMMDVISGPKWVKDFEDPKNKSWEDVMYDLAVYYVKPDNIGKYKCISLFFSLFLVPIIEYLNDNLESRILVIDNLKKFKQKCEWFDKEIMNKSYIDGKSNGEKILKKFLYEFLFNKNIHFYIEPASPSGEIDFLINQSGEEKIGCEAKVYKGNNKSDIIHGIETQLMTYLREHCLTVGYMVVFKVAKREIQISLDCEQEINFIDIDGKRIYLFVVDIYKHEKSASKRDKSKKDKENIKPDIISKVDFLNSRQDKKSNKK